MLKVCKQSKGADKERSVHYYEMLRYCVQPLNPPIHRLRHILYYYMSIYDLATMKCLI